MNGSNVVLWLWKCNQGYQNLLNLLDSPCYVSMPKSSLCFSSEIKCIKITSPGHLGYGVNVTKSQNHSWYYVYNKSIHVWWKCSHWFRIQIKVNASVKIKCVQIDGQWMEWINLFMFCGNPAVDSVYRWDLTLRLKLSFRQMDGMTVKRTETRYPNSPC